MPTKTEADIEIDLARLDRAVILGLLSEQAAEVLQVAVRNTGRRAVDLMLAGIPPKTEAERAQQERLAKVLTEYPYAE